MSSSDASPVGTPRRIASNQSMQRTAMINRAERLFAESELMHGAVHHDSDSEEFPHDPLSSFHRRAAADGSSARMLSSYSACVPSHLRTPPPRPHGCPLATASLAWRRHPPAQPQQPKGTIPGDFRDPLMQRGDATPAKRKPSAIFPPLIPRYLPPLDPAPGMMTLLYVRRRCRADRQRRKFTGRSSPPLRRAPWYVRGTTLWSVRR